MATVFLTTLKDIQIREVAVSIKQKVELPMQKSIRLGQMLLAMALTMAGCAKKGAPEFVQVFQARAQLESFAAEKESQARALALADGRQLPPEAEEFFTAIKNANWEEATNGYAEAKYFTENDLPNNCGSWWQPVLETYGAAEQFTLGDPKYAAIYGNDIIQSIPPGSIYFGGTDPGRFVVTMMQKSHEKGDPFFGLSQNPLTDTTYLEYIRSIYGGKIYIPTTNDSQKCYDEYYRDYQRHANSYSPIIEIRGFLTRVIFDQNSNREFYVEESFPLEWMYPYLEPHSLIFKLNRQPLAQLSDDAVQKDHDYWTNTISPMIGDWLDNDTSLSDVAAFSEKVFLHNDFSGFIGDTNFVRNSYANRMFSKERSSIAGLFAWRASHATDPAEKERMRRAADLAFRQSWALCPYSPEVVFRYVGFLMDEKRPTDALLVAETAAKFPGTDMSQEQIKTLAEQLKRYQDHDPSIRFTN